VLERPADDSNPPKDPMKITNAADIVEDSLRLLDEVSVDDQTFRSVARQLYEFSGHYESRATFFRMMDVLVDRGYFVVVPVEKHPGYEEYREALESPGRESVSPVFRDPSGEGDEETNPVVGYETDGELYVERGGELFDELVEAEVLGGEEAAPPGEETLFGAVAAVCEEAEQSGEMDLVLRWYATLGFHLGMQAGDEEDAWLEAIDEDPGAARIREIVAQVDDLELELANPKRGLDLPPKPLREAHPVLGRWFDLL
jgi:hypothetical protein